MSQLKLSFETLIENKDVVTIESLTYTEKDNFLTLLWERNNIEDIQYFISVGVVKEFHLSARINELLKSGNTDGVKLFVEHNVIDIEQIFSIMIGKMNQNSQSDLEQHFSFITPYLTDGHAHSSFKINDWHYFYLAKDSFLEFLLRCISLGMDFDGNELFYNCFIDKRVAYKTANYVIDNFDVDLQLIQKLEHYISVKYKGNDPLIEKLVNKGMKYIEPALKKTKIEKAFTLTPNESIEGMISFINKHIVAMDVYDHKTKQSRTDFYDLKTDDAIYSIECDMDSFAKLAYSAWGEGIVLLSSKSLYYLSLTPTKMGETITLTDNSNDVLLLQEWVNIQHYPIDNVEILAKLANDEFSRKVETLGIFALNNTTLLLFLSAATNKSGRALGLIKISKSAANILNVYQTISESRWLGGVTYLNNKIFCLSTSDTVADKLGTNYSSYALSSYQYNGDELENESNHKNNRWSLFSSSKKLDPFIMADNLSHLDGDKMYFSYNGEFITNYVGAKNRIFFYKTVGHELKFEMRITKAQSLNDIKLTDAKIVIYDDERFIVHDQNKWNLCKIIN